MVSVLRSGKGHDVLFRAIPDLRRRIPDVAVKIVGAGEIEAELRRAAAPLGDCVEFVGQLYEDLPVAFWASDVLTLPSRAEGLPIVLIEAAAAGLPAVATDVGGCAEVVDDGETGYLVARGDHRALAERLARLLADADGARRMGTTARARAERRFSLDGQARATADLYRRILAR
jgi:phosphatidylinositol alpha-1,6-mannosyltransferase